MTTASVANIYGALAVFQEPIYALTYISPLVILIRAKAL